MKIGLIIALYVKHVTSENSTTKTTKWVRFSYVSAYVYVAAVFTCAYACKKVCYS